MLKKNMDITVLFTFAANELSSPSTSNVELTVGLQDTEENKSRILQKQSNCELCSVCFKSDALLWMHKRQEHGIPLTAAPEHLKHFRCEECSYETLILTNFRRHHKSAHEEKSRISCSECDSSFKTKFGLTKHIQRQHSKKDSTCPHCRQKVSPKDLSSHIFRSHREPAQHRDTLMCSLCPYMAKQSHSLYLHLWKHHDVQPPDHFKRYECPHCEYKVLSRKSALDDHMRLHLGITPHQCEECQKTFNSKSRLQNHSKTHGERKHGCTQCEKKFSFASNLKSHMLTCHLAKEADRVWKCELCQYSSKLKGNLRLHLRNTHKQVVASDARRVQRIPIGSSSSNVVDDENVIIQPTGVHVS
ncbi:hypothetical protein CAPTEDRAFT_219140 [Capitella teleta]|uniref:C2H2-type domain-containing protein n=1 Tax=Capitella teleta TaxID=283909 RepID=R7UK45_CAPTE|nr:hypothetical protein CAPTEDRAFT_219140 [Capitella teleta]|eukprot:ELU03652.1 hypothetical protein CAPTEDRAFT_219140 [Capitella teleta]